MDSDTFIVHHEPFSLSREERFRHAFVVGKSGVGKSTFLFNMALEDIEAGHGIAFVDPHGDEATRLLASIPQQRINDVVYFSVRDTNYPVAFNPIGGVPLADRPRRVSALVSALAHIFADAWGHSTQQIVTHGIATLMDAENQSLVAFPRLLVDHDFRAQLLPGVTNPVTAQYWATQFEEYQQQMRDSKSAPPLNKLESLIMMPEIRNILSVPRNRIDPRAIIDQRKIFIVDLSKGRIGDGANLLGTLIMSLLGSAAYERTDTPEEDRVDFYLYADEFHNFTSNQFATYLAELRKYKCGMIFGNQWIDQCSDNIRAAILGAVGTLIVFECSPTDAALLSAEFDQLDPSHLANQQLGHAWVRRETSFDLWTGSRRKHFRFPTRRTAVDAAPADVVLARSRRVYATTRAQREANLYRYFTAAQPPIKDYNAREPRKGSKRLLSPIAAAAIRADLLSSIVDYAAGDGLSDIKTCVRYAPRVLATQFDGVWSQHELEDALGLLLADGTLTTLKIREPGRPTITKIVRA